MLSKYSRLVCCHITYRLCCRAVSRGRRTHPLPLVVSEIKTQFSIIWACLRPPLAECGFAILYPPSLLWLRPCVVLLKASVWLRSFAVAIHSLLRPTADSNEMKCYTNAIYKSGILTWTWAGFWHIPSLVTYTLRCFRKVHSIRNILSSVSKCR